MNFRCTARQAAALFTLVLSLLLVSACGPRTSDESPVKSSTEADAVITDAETDLGEPQPAELEPQLAETANEATSEETETQTLIEDMGFSTLSEAELQTEPDELSTEAPYCLGNNAAQSGISVETACERISNRLASVSKSGCDSANLQPSQCESVDGFPILYREFAPLHDRQPQGRILVIGGIHGDELTSVSIVFKWIEKLNRFHSGLFHWHVVPMMNPDGVLPRAAQRTNKNGVDLNRNLPSDDWQENALKYWRDKQGENPRRYPGTAPASEPETQWLIDEINAFKPDAIISVHAPYGVVDFDALLLNTAPKSLGKLHLNLLGTYPGSLGNYAGINRDIPVITLELPHAWVMPSEQETSKIWEDIVSWLRKNVNQDLAAQTGGE